MKLEAAVERQRSFLATTFLFPFHDRMKNPITRRDFLKRASAGGIGLVTLGTAGAFRAAAGPNDKIVLGIMGCNGRGMAHIAEHLAVPNVEIAHVCDVDSRAVEKGVAAVAKKQPRQPQGVKDFRRMLEDKSVDAISIATPDHWHAPATIVACAAGKHVYVEKPGSHNPHESELMVTAARQHKRVVQMGNQRRSWPYVIDAIKAVHSGEIGRVFFARAWYTNGRGSIGRGKPAPVPEWLDYSLWQGPAPEREFRDNVIHYNWHWFWHWGTGELGNNGVHALDLARWGLGVDLPKRITCGGNRYHYQDDWETPDLYVTTFDYGDKAIVWEGQSCDPRGFEGAGFGVNFHGEKGTMVMAGDAGGIYDLSNKLVRELGGKRGDTLHFANFADGIRVGKKLNSEIEDGQKSTMLCHLGNIAWRTGHTINCDAKSGKLVGDREAANLWRREYRKGWEPKV
ncbi:MAG TPA: Gfo/Idh/MocA family oxidoreductase [Verrucomicrobiae bacterium]|nr:Gfo/Idh/MocA family oxidoreductase [Verrucomicrobiae bacterium]